MSIFMKGDSKTSFLLLYPDDILIAAKLDNSIDKIREGQNARLIESRTVVTYSRLKEVL